MIYARCPHCNYEHRINYYQPDDPHIQKLRNECDFTFAFMCEACEALPWGEVDAEMIYDQGAGHWKLDAGRCD